MAEDEHHLTGRVSDVAFRGRGYELAIDLPGARLTGVYAPHRTARGEQVRLRLDPAGCLAFPLVLAEGTAFSGSEATLPADLTVDLTVTPSSP